MGDDNLLRRAQRGDVAAIDELCRREWGGVYAIVYAAVRHRGEAEDLTQDVFVRALRALDRYHDTGVPFRAYLATIARNRVRDHWRLKRPVTVALAPVADHIAGGEEPEAVVTEAELPDWVAAALARLPADYQTVLRLRIEEDRSMEIVAGIMHRSPGAIRVLQYRALGALRRLLEEGADS